MEKIMEERKVVGKRLEKRFSAIELNHLAPLGRMPMEMDYTY